MTDEKSGPIVVGKQAKLCGRVAEGKECVYAAIQKMIEGMKQDIAKAQAIPYPEQIVVAKIYDIVANIMSESCRAANGIARQECGPSAGFRTETVTLDAFILLNQLREDGLISAEYKDALFAAMANLSPEIKKLVESDAAQGIL